MSTGVHDTKREIWGEKLSRLQFKVEDNNFADGQLFVIVAVSPQRRQVRERLGGGHSFAGIIIVVYSDAGCGDDDNNLSGILSIGGSKMMTYFTAKK